MHVCMRENKNTHADMYVCVPQKKNMVLLVGAGKGRTADMYVCAPLRPAPYRDLLPTEPCFPLPTETCALPE